jgi:predicted N-formylglutamate amidohydrolase
VIALERADYSMPVYKHQLVLSCEHASYRIPDEYKRLFRNAKEHIKTHRGYDIGSVKVAKYLAQDLDTDLLLASYSRLLIDLNRSTGHQHLFSAFTCSLPLTERQRIIDTYYHPYRNSVYQQIENRLQGHFAVLHLSVHSFTPFLDGIERSADIGLLYDPKSSLEKQFCLQWQRNMYELDDDFRSRRNYPYRGNADGLTTRLRKQFSTKPYLGIELEINQKLFQPGQEKKMKTLNSILATSLAKTIDILLN